MSKTHETIKGSCENCGFAFTGTIKVTHGVYPSSVPCPGCHLKTMNWDAARYVDALDREESHALDYQEVTFA